MPIVKFNGKVIPKLLVIDSDGLASGSAIPTAAGAAIYDALAAKTPRTVAPPTDKPARYPPTTPNVPDINGNKRANANKPTPVSLIT